MVILYGNLFLNEVGIMDEEFFIGKKSMLIKVNGEYILPDKLPNKDMLKNMFDMNKTFTDAVRDEEKPRADLAENVIVELIHICGEEGVGGFDDDDLARFDKAINDARMLRNAVAMNAEVAEYIDELPWKWWGRGKHRFKPHEKKKAAMELIDLLHFINIAFDDLGYNADDIYNLYCEKHIENRRRFLEKRGWDKANR